MKALSDSDTAPAMWEQLAYEGGVVVAVPMNAIRDGDDAVNLCQSCVLVRSPLCSRVTCVDVVFLPAAMAAKLRLR